MNCKTCSNPICVSIEGESICNQCWANQQMTTEEKSLTQEILEFEKEEKANKKFYNDLVRFEVKPDYVDSFTCQVGEYFFDAEVYLGDLAGRSSNEIAKDLAECIKATFDELN